MGILGENLQHSLSHSNPEIYQTMWGPSEFKVTGNLKNFERVNDLAKLIMSTLITCGRFDEASP
jgi:proline iminopeptidase